MSVGLLDQPDFDYAHPDASALVERLTKLIGDKSRAKLLASASGISEGMVDWDGPMADVWPPLLVHAAAHGRLRSLVTKALESVPAEDLFERLLAERHDPVEVTGAVSLFGTPRLWKTDALIGRGELRRHVRSLVDPDGHRALIVTAESGLYGKSHSRRYISYLSEKGQLPRASIIDASRRAGPPMCVRELARRVSTALACGGVPSFDLVAQDESVVTEFHLWLEAAVLELEAPVWLIFDGFTSDTASASALQLMHELTSAVADHQYRFLRVVVLGLEGDVPSYSGTVCERLGHPTDADVKAFFTAMSGILASVSSDDAAIELLFDQFVSQEGPIAGCSWSRLGPSALSFAVSVYGQD